jgi:hypothetical protein
MGVNPNVLYAEWRQKRNGAPGEIRTPDLLVRSQALYPTELRAQAKQRLTATNIGGEGGIRTLEGLLTLTPLAGARLRPLGHLSRKALGPIQGARDDTRLKQSR